MAEKNVNIVPQTEEYDAIVVGSGITGGWAAKELTEKGLQTLLLERGPNVKHGDYPTEHMPTWEAEFRGLGDRRLFEEEYPKQLRAGIINEFNYHFFANEKKHPYQTDEENPYLWVRGYQVGGKSLTWGRQTYRLSDLDFEANVRDGIGVDWPIRYKDIAPWYDYVEEFAGISGKAEGLPHLPDGKFLPPMEMTCVERHVKEQVEATFPDRMITIGRCAVLTQPHKGRGECHYCGPCWRGCSVGAYFSSQASTLPAARKTGNMTLRPNSIVHSIIYDKETGKASGVRVIDRESKESLEFSAKVIFLCASALGSTQIMLNSTSDTFPNGIANRSGALGHYLMDHHFQVGASAEFSGFNDKYYYGNRPNGVYVPRFRNLDDETAMDEFIRGFGFECWSGRSGWSRGNWISGFGKEFKKELRDPGNWYMTMLGFGETLPYYDNHAKLSDKKDDWGIPQLEIHASIKENEEKMRKDMAATAAEMLEAGGGENVEPFFDEYLPGEGIHEMGTARMGRNPETSVLNGHNQAHDVPNLFVTDGACMTSSACQNPSLTYMALTARACDFAVNELKKGNI